MAIIGLLAKANITQSTIVDVYTVPASTATTFNVSVCNRNGSTANVRLALSDSSGTQNDDEYIEYNTPISSYSVLERTGLVLQAGKILTVYSDTDNVSVVVFGIEKGV